MTVPGLDVPGLDVLGLQDWLRRTHLDLSGGALSAQVIAHGRSNLTYAIAGARKPLIVRRPPLGHVLSTAHDMRREHRVISALSGTGVPVPTVVDLVDDSATAAVTGTTFFVMERAPGVILSEPRHNGSFTRDGLRRLSLELARCLADLHAVDPATVGLGDFGRPNGYLDRQLATWRRQLDASRSRELPELDTLQARLEDARPTSTVASIVHGDFRLDNVLVVGDGDEPRISAILDWEMATLGDPLVDLGIFGLYWDLASVPGLSGDALSTAVDPAAGYPGFGELVEAYAARAGIAPPDLRWYRAFAAFKLAVIAEGIHYRHLSGDTVGSGFDRMGELVEPLAMVGLGTTLTPDNGPETP